MILHVPKKLLDKESEVFDNNLEIFNNKLLPGRAGGLPFLISLEVFRGRLLVLVVDLEIQIHRHLLEVINKEVVHQLVETHVNTNRRSLLLLVQAVQAVAVAVAVLEVALVVHQLQVQLLTPLHNHKPRVMPMLMPMLIHQNRLINFNKPRLFNRNSNSVFN